MKLLIVESGAKAKTIETYLGAGWKVMASFGHIQDMPPKALGYDETTFAIDYYPLPDKRPVIQRLKEAAANADAIYLAADPDREGEAIAAALQTLFLEFRRPMFRVKFHEITRRAIQAAISNPTTVSRPLVEAQETRRILDRMAGYKVSPLLWRQLSDHSLSAGRVQSAALSVLCDSAREFSTWEPALKYSLEGQFPGVLIPLASGSSSLSQSTRDQLVPLMAKEWALSVTPGRREQKPPPPYITSTLQSDAANRLGASIKQVMALAQELYEAGHITYMRTDSTALSEEMRRKMQSHITKTHGETYLSVAAPVAAATSKNAQEAHECIRPAHLSTMEPEGVSARAKQLYSLIWRRTVQSLMAPAVFRTYAWLAAHGSFKLHATEEFGDFPGFKILDPEYAPPTKKEEAREAVLRGFKPQKVKPISLSLRPLLTSAPRLYTEGSFVSRMEELGIGRPSTYVSTLERIMQRSYIELRPLPPREVAAETFSISVVSPGVLKTEPVKLATTAMTRLMPTAIGMMVERYLKEHFPYLCDPKFTSLLENDLDAITHGKKTKKQVCRVLQKELEESIAVLAKQPKIRDAATAAAENRREIRPGIVVRKARYGPVIEVAPSDAGDKPSFISLTPYLQWQKVSLQSIPENHILFLSSLPVPYVFKEQEYELHFGRYGFYLFDPREKKNVPFPKKLWRMLLP